MYEMYKHPCPGRGHDLHPIHEGSNTWSVDGNAIYQISGKDRSVGLSSISHAGGPGSNPCGGLTLGHTL